MIGCSILSLKRFGPCWPPSGKRRRIAGKPGTLLISPAKRTPFSTPLPSVSAKVSSTCRNLHSRNFKETWMTQENQSGLEPLGRAVLVKMYEPTQKKGSVIHIPETVQERSSVMEQQAIVVAIGPACWSDEPAPRCAVGDKVIVTKLAGYVTRGTNDHQLYRLVNDRDIFCKIVKETERESGHG